MSVVLHGKAQDPKTMVSNRVILHSRLILQNVVNRLGEQANEGVPFGGCDKYTAQLESEHLAHSVQCSFQLCRSIPATIFAGP